MIDLLVVFIDSKIYSSTMLFHSLALCVTHCLLSCQVVYTDVYMLDDEMKWKVLPPMPKANSHIEFAWVVVNNSVVIVGGTTEKHPETKKMVLNGEVMQFNLNTSVLTSLTKHLGKLSTLLHICSLSIIYVLTFSYAFYSFICNNAKKYPFSVICKCYLPLT